MYRLGVQGAGVEGAAEGLIGRRGVPAVILAALTAVGFAIRLQVAGDDVFADELSTYWIVSTRDLAGVVSTVHTEAEITPPLSFVLSWLTTRVELSPQLLRAPALAAGTATIPLIYMVGLRTVGRFAALVAATLTAFAPFMVYYSAEARGYGLAMMFVTLSTLAVLQAVDAHRSRWWGVYAASACAAVYTHYTTVFPLGAQLSWLLWAHPGARRAALLATGAAIAGFLPWASGLVGDFGSPTTDILSFLSPFDPRTVRIALEHWSIGYPYSVVGLRQLPGVAALAALAVGLVLALWGLIRSWIRVPASAAGNERRWWRLARAHPRVVLVAALALSAPIVEALVSAVGTNLFGTRNLAASWPGFVLALAALLGAAGARLRIVAAVLTIACFAVGAARMLEPRFQRPDYDGVAGFIQREASPGDVVVDGATISPGPVGGIDVPLGRSYRVLRVGAPQQRDHPFSVFDPVLPLSEVARRAVEAAGGRRIFVLSMAVSGRDDRARERLLPGYRRVRERTYPGIVTLDVAIYARPPSQPG